MCIRDRHKGLHAFVESGSKAGIQPHHGKKLERLLARLDVAKWPEDMNLPGWRLHNLAGDPAGFQSVTVNGNWRIIFTFQDGDAVLVD